MNYTLREQPQTDVISLGRRVQAIGGEDSARGAELLQALFDRILRSMGDLTITGDRPEIRFRKAGTLAMPMLSRYAILAATAAAGHPPDLDAILRQLPAKHTAYQRSSPTVRVARIRAEAQEPGLHTIDLLAGNSYLTTEREQARTALVAASPGTFASSQALSINLVEMRDVTPNPRLQDDIRGVITDAIPRTTGIRVGAVTVLEVAGPSFEQQYVSVPLA